MFYPLQTFIILNNRMKNHQAFNRKSKQLNGFDGNESFPGGWQNYHHDRLVESAV